MIVDPELLTKFEAGLDPARIEQSDVPAKLLGYGEISAIFQIGSDDTVAFKRMPLFSDRAAAENYENQYYEYCCLLSKAGLNLPESSTCIVEVPDRPVVLYIAQQKLLSDRVGHKLIHTLENRDRRAFLRQIVHELEKIWSFNASHRPQLELAIDGQISNWVLLADEEGISSQEGDPSEKRVPSAERTGSGERVGQVYYLDTSTPLYRKYGVEQLDPRLLLQSAPGYLRWFVERLFLDDVMNRYYSPRKVCIDLAANLYKEQRPDLISEAMEIINHHGGDQPFTLTETEVRRYYREDKIIWSAFLNLRKIDRWISTKLLRKRYEFILPGKIKR